MQKKTNQCKINGKNWVITNLLKFCFLTLLLSSIIYSLTIQTVNAQRLNYPPSHTDEVVDDYFGTKVADPYRWLEDPDSPETQAWVEAQNKLTFEYLNSTPEREKIKARLSRLWNYPRYSTPEKLGSRYFFTKNDGLQNQAVLYRLDSLEGKPVVVIDPNKFSTDGTVALSDKYFSLDGSLLAYLISRSGSDLQEMKVLNIDTGKEYDEVIKWCRFSAVAWKADHQGFFYNRYPEPGTVAESDQVSYNRVYWHKLGTSQAEDKLVYEEPENKELAFSPIGTEDGKYLILFVWEGTDENNRIYYREMGSEGDFIKLLDKADANYSFIDNLDTIFFFRTDLDAPRKRVIAINIKNPGRENWKEIIPERKESLDFVSLINHQFVTVYIEDVKHKIKLHSLVGTFIKEIQLPDLGTIEIDRKQISGGKEDKEMFFEFTSFLYPPTIFRYDFTTEKLSPLFQPEVDFDLTSYESKQVFFTSKDGTKVPMFIVHKKGLKLDGNNPLLLYGYGGFNQSYTPYYSSSRPIFLENEGVYVLVNLRGGGEYGEEWHRGGMLEKKQNVFDDFIAAAEWLVENKYTNPQKIAIDGGSNGGLLVAACMLQRPELFGAVVCEAPLIDMLRYHKFTVGKYWVSELGNAEENPEHFKFIYAYSPLHNVKEGVSYPPILITSADTDDRVVPAHAKKFAAALQTKSTGDNPVLLRVETKAGHGQGKPTSKRIDESSDIYTFLFKILGMSIK